MVAFLCNPGLAPSQQMMSVCAANGSWTPDPAELVCRGRYHLHIGVHKSILQCSPFQLSVEENLDFQSMLL